MAVAPPYVNRRDNALYIDLFGDSTHYYTSGDRIHGVVRVNPDSRPQRVTLVFKGTSTIHDLNAKAVKIELFRYSLDLFESSGNGDGLDTLRRDTAKDGKVELPFEFTFPQTVELSPPQDREWWYSQDVFNHPRFQHSPGFPLPPSYTLSKFGTGPLISGPIVADPEAVYIRYYLEARIEISTSDTSNAKPPPARQELHFIPPAPPYDTSLLHPLTDFGTNIPKQFCRYKFIRTRNLLPNYEKSSKRGRVKDFLVEKELFFGLHSYSEVPFVRFDLFAIPARIVRIGSPFPIALKIEHLERSKSLPHPPKLFLRRVRVQITARYYTFIPTAATQGQVQHARKEETHTITSTLTLADRKFDSGAGELMYHDMDLARVADLHLGLANDKLIPSFTSYGLALEHEVQVHVWGECAKHGFEGLACKEMIQIVSPWVMEPPPLLPGVGESRREEGEALGVPPPPYGS
ncbi:hypothetical protein P153DRAFT_298746 [Dothidotthia symphoricarpi CBS 119687]|uniref:Arrestin-like N-terminal domain-containing protein n=1 Tax=Dothidotthia symphoricarpi CBS 119687 TaxID=1392245 RepID=A0A6A6A661_9PLEO|nr:uncharacterized protein P153DRAFT_298746 [Dothidotthia symphoricarpi CBS 119687]KAF2126101.1 hypothetical protein P153DRAFT_298746 [Dothidotthia symphoricarpi CBS 119687]